MKRRIGLGCVGLVAAFGLFVLNASQAQPADPSTNLVEAGRARFNIRCAGCHGQDGLGGERAPAIANGSRLGLDNDKALRNLIQHGIADKGMPAFTVPADELNALAAFALSRMQPLSKTALSGRCPHRSRVVFRQGRLRAVPHGLGQRQHQRAGSDRSGAQADPGPDGNGAAEACCRRWRLSGGDCQDRER